MNYSLKANVKRQAGRQHPDRNTQFEYIEAQKQYFLSKGWSIISMDVKKQELIGNFKNNGQSWCLEAEHVNDHDFKLDALGRAVPYGIYVVNHNQGYVYVGQSVDTAEFAVDVLTSWWQDFGQFDFPDASCMLILCDSGGSNGYRLRLWKVQLPEQLADKLRLSVTVCHYPSGTQLNLGCLDRSVRIGQASLCVPSKSCWLVFVAQPPRLGCRCLLSWSRKSMPKVSKSPRK